jgi:hypothetical protein
MSSFDDELRKAAGLPTDAEKALAQKGKQAQDAQWAADAPKREAHLLRYNSVVGPIFQLYIESVQKVLNEKRPLYTIQKGLVHQMGGTREILAVDVYNATAQHQSSPRRANIAALPNLIMGSINVTLFANGSMQMYVSGSRVKTQVVNDTNSTTIAVDSSEADIKTAIEAKFIELVKVVS